jgi:hypothetical protein
MGGCYIRSTPVRRTCPICGEKSRDLQDGERGQVVLADMCPACWKSVENAENVFWSTPSYMIWAAERARRCERKRWRKKEIA